MKLWSEGKVAALVHDFEVEVALRGSPSRKQDEDAAFRAFNTRVLNGQIRSTVCLLTAREGGGGVYDVEDLDSKTGRPVGDVLRSKHPLVREPTDMGIAGGSFEHYNSAPRTVIPIVITVDMIADVASKLSGSAGPSGIDSEMLKRWLLGFGYHSGANSQISPRGSLLQTLLGQCTEL